jgi:transposase
MPQLAYGIMDKGYDSDPIRQHLQAHEVTPVIPPRHNRKEPILYDTEQYKLREKVERFFNKLKHFRRIATRYEKLLQTFLALIHLVASWVMIS